MPSSYQQRIKEKEELKDKLEKEQVVKGGVMNIASKLNYERQVYMNTKDALFDIIVKYGNEQALREAYKTIGQFVSIKYEAIVGKKTNKKGEEYDCWVSVWDKYAGKITTNKKPPLCNGYVKYINDEDFDFDEINRKFVYKYDKATINNKEVNIVK